MKTSDCKKSIDASFLPPPPLTSRAKTNHEVESSPQKRHYAVIPPKSSSRGKRHRKREKLSLSSCHGTVQGRQSVDIENSDKSNAVGGFWLDSDFSSDVAGREPV
jgi:hypothetical protein